MSQLNLYTMKDNLSGIFGSPFVSYNEATAKREFEAFCKLRQNKYIAPNMELYFIGGFDSSTGECEVHPLELIYKGCDFNITYEEDGDEY